MSALQQYVLDPVSTGNLDDHTIDVVMKIIRTCLESSYDLEGFKVEFNNKLTEGSLDWDGVGVLEGVAGIGRNLFLKINWFRSVGNYNILVWAKFHSVRSLQDLAAYQVACSIKSRTNLEQLPVPPLVKRIVGKFMETSE